MDKLTTMATPGVYTATGAGTIAILEISKSQTIAWLLHEVTDHDDLGFPKTESHGGPINGLNIHVGIPGILQGAGTLGDAELGSIVTIAKLRPRVP